MSRVALTGVAGLGPFQQTCDTVGDGVFRRVLAEVGVSPNLFEKPENKIPLPAMLALFERAARIAGEPLFGLRLGEEMAPADFGLWVRYLMSGPNLAAMIRRSARAIAFHQPGASFSLERKRDIAVWRYRASFRTGPGHVHHSDHVIAPMLQCIRGFAGPLWAPEKIELDYPQPRHWRRVEQALGVPVVFKAPGLGIVFSSSMLDLPRIDPVPLGSLITFTDLRRIVTDRPARTMGGAIRQLITFGSEGSCRDMGSVAHLLHLSHRSIQRELQREGVSFREILGEARRAEAERLLVGTTASLKEIAWRLGYSEHQHFTRAFLGWAGVTPSAYRERALKMASSG